MWGACGHRGASHSPTALPLRVLQERVAALESHAEQVRLQAAQEAQRLGREKSATLQLLRKVPLGRGAGGGQGPKVAVLLASQQARLTPVPTPDRRRRRCWPWRGATEP